MNTRTETWSVINQKGGVGKTTSAIALGALHARAGRRSLLIDLDPHGSASHYFDRHSESLFGALRDPGQRPDAESTGVEGLSLLPACPELATLGRDTAASTGRGGIGLALQCLIERLEGFDIVIVDGPPTLGVLMINALVAADRLVVPTLTDPLALHGVASLDRTLTQIQRSLGRRPPWRIVATQFDRRTRSAPAGLRLLQARWGEAVWDEYIPVDTQIREASARGQVLEQHAPDCRAARAYRRLYADLCNTPAQRPDATRSAA